MSTNRALAVEITANSSQYVQQLNQAARATETQAQRMRTSLDSAGSSARGNGQMFTQFGYQVNDVAAQMAAGTSVVQAFGQQAGQLLQAFGPFGAILGAAITVGSMFAVTMMDGKDAAEKAKKATEDYADAVEFGKAITETSTETQRRHNEEKRQGAIDTLRLKKEEEDLAAARLKMQISELETLRGYGDFDSAGAGDMSSTFNTAGVELDRLKGLLAELQKSSATTATSLNNVMNPKAGWQDDFRAPKVDTDALEEYMTTLRQSVDLQKLDERARVAREAVIRAENAAQQEQKTLTEDQIATVKRLALERYDIEQAQKPQKDDEVEAYIQSLKDSAAALEVENRARAVREALIKAQNIAMEEGTILTDAQTEAVKNLAGASYDLAEAQRRAKEEAKDNEKLMKEVSMTFESAFEDAIIAGKKFSDVLNAIGEDIAKLIIRQAVTAPLGNAIQSSMSNAGGVGGIMGSLVSGVSGLFGGLAGARAAGGPVNAGSAYLVGERGPEIVVPSAPGTVIPNHKLGNLGGGGTTVVNQTIQISTGVAATVQAEIRNHLPMIANVTKAAISNDQARKGRSL